ncbi:MAG TPA: NAD-dependent epimerase/dehydratase family protein, partial [Polyangiaceae bacterium]|nr:NAD-dependent epimerase/dehydratase family protein [Polyangiaceae bacterium]
MSSRGVCAVTGSNGYVGSCIKGFLATRGWDILEVTRRPKPGTRSVAFQLGADVAPASLEGVDALVHCAYDFKPLHWDDIHAVNVSGTEKLFAAARAAGVE